MRESERSQLEKALRQQAGCIRAPSLVLVPKLVPMVITPGFIEGAQVT